MLTMRLIVFTVLLGIATATHAQNLKPLSEAEVDSLDRKDKLNGTLKDWTKAEVKAFRKECVEQVTGKVNDPKGFCSCAQPVVAENLNYNSFMERSEYQRGRTLGHLARGHCQ